MIVNKINDNDLLNFEVKNEIVVDKNIIGEFIKDTAELVVLNKNHQYDILDKNYINITKFGEWYVEEIENDEENESLTLKLCDKSKKFDEDYEDTFPFPAHMKDWAVWIGDKVGVPLKGNFLNEDLILKERPYIGTNPKWRDAVRKIAKYASSWADINNDGSYSIKWFEDKVYTIDDWEKFKHGITTKPTNVLILSTGITEDNVRWPETIPNDPHELKIEDEWTNIDRYEINETIYNQVKGFFYTSISDLTLLYGIFELKPGQKIKTKDFELNNIETYISSHTLTWDGGNWEDENSWTSTIKMLELQETTTKYQYSNSVENRLGKAEINVDKNNKKIEMMAEDIGEVQRTMTTKKSQKGNPIEINDAGAYPVKKAIVYGKSLKADNKIYIVEGVEQTSGETDEDTEYTSNYLSLYAHGRNIFNKNNYISLFGHINSGILTPNKGNYTLIIPIKPNTTYVIQKMISTRFIVGTSNTYPNLTTYNETYNCWDFTSQVQLNNVVSVSNKESLVYTTESNAKYLYFEFWVNNESTTKQEILDSIMISKENLLYDYDDYKINEVIYDLQDNFLGQVGEVKDELDFNTGVLTKRIGKLTIDGTEKYEFEVNMTSWAYPRYTIYKMPSDYESSTNPIDAICNYAEFTPNNSSYTNYDETFLTRYINGQGFRIDIMSSVLGLTTVDEFKSKLQKNPLVIYYVLNKPYTVQLKKQESLELFLGYNYITCNDSLMPEIEIDYLTDSEFNTQYASKSELDITNEKVSIITESQEDITELVNNNAIDINNKFSDLNSVLNEELANNTDAIINLNKTVEQLQTNSEIVFDFKNSIEVNGVTKLETSNSYTFDENGLKIKDSESNIGSELDNKGLLIEDTSGAETEELLYAGIDDVTNEAVVRTKNISVSQYFNMGSNSRFEDFIDEDGEEGTGVFFVGVESDD